jgi:hypothetical protein
VALNRDICPTVGDTVRARIDAVTDPGDWRSRIAAYDRTGGRDDYPDTQDGWLATFLRRHLPECEI